MAIALAREGGIGVVHRNLSIPEQVAEVDRVKRSEAGMITEPVTLPPSALVRDALELMARYRISGVPITDAEGLLVGILTNRDLRFQRDETRARLGADDGARARHRAAGHDASRGRGDPAPAQDREAADRRLRRPHHGADHRQGHPEARGLSARHEGRAGTAPGRRRRRRRARRARSCGGARRRRRRRARARHRARPLAVGDRDGAQAEVGSRRGARRGERRDRGGGRSADRRRRRRGEGGRRSGVDLHDARRRRRGRPADHRDLRLRAGVRAARRAADRRRRDDLLRRPREGARRRSRRRDARARSSPEPRRARATS